MTSWPANSTNPAVNAPCAVNRSHRAMDIFAATTATKRWRCVAHRAWPLSRRMPADMSVAKRPKKKWMKFINCCDPRRRRRPQMNPRDLHKIEIVWQQSGWNVPIRQGGRTVLEKADFARGGFARLSLQSGSTVAAFHEASVYRPAPVGRYSDSPQGRSRLWKLLSSLVLPRHGCGRPISGLFSRSHARGWLHRRSQRAGHAYGPCKNRLSANSTSKRKE